MAIAKVMNIRIWMTVCFMQVQYALTLPGRFSEEQKLAAVLLLSQLLLFPEFLRQIQSIWHLREANSHQNSVPADIQSFCNCHTPKRCPQFPCLKPYLLHMCHLQGLLGNCCTCSSSTPLLHASQRVQTIKPICVLWHMQFTDFIRSLCQVGTLDAHPACKHLLRPDYLLKLQTPSLHRQCLYGSLLVKITA